ncbi:MULTISPECIES: MFS transporter [Tatumella]|uniref:MFS transporter n=1 Tax=Tatumella punctata TaxID=399969 RepID=A0ABW1VU84_9GAMM|nr:MULTISPECIES: MFS transporter [unclassified Tatumella]MBS0855313.1 MFS transporter [Tatumella sp. JGM16]MBS0892786.1 MFS transporter [Tatumella sp. JGM130]MBS0911870.1 MFS transporter [Tatumella sp. JGM91]
MEKTELQPVKSNSVFVFFMLVTFSVSIAGALQAPTLSLFLSRELHAAPFEVGLFFTVNAITGIIVSFLLARRSDKRGDRRNLLMFCCLMAIGNALVFAFTRSYWLLIGPGLLLAAFTTVVVPQIFALAREYADSTRREVVMFSSLMRAQMSLAWVIGPPLSFAVALTRGFMTLYLFAAVLFVISLILIRFTLPSVPKIFPADNLARSTVSGWKNTSTRGLFIASVLMWTCNMMYIIDMPLYISSTLGMPEKVAGVLMGTAAGLEIPVMILAGMLAKRIGKRPLVLLAVTAGVLFYPGMLLFHTYTSLLALQVFNAIFIGIVAGLVMLWFQDLMPGQAGVATTMFTNSVSTGMIFAGVLQGSISSWWGHEAIYWLASGLTVIALLLTWRVKESAECGR